jgi:hypothetical protein
VPALQVAGPPLVDGQHCWPSSPHGTSSGASWFTGPSVPPSRADSHRLAQWAVTQVTAVCRQLPQALPAAVTQAVVSWQLEVARHSPSPSQRLPRVSPVR